MKGEGSFRDQGRSIPGGEGGTTEGHVSPLFVVGVAFLFGSVATLALAAGWGLLAILAFGLVGVELRAPSGRVFAFVFSAVFVGMTALGWFSWLCDRLAAQASDTAGGYGGEAEVTQTHHHTTGEKG